MNDEEKRIEWDVPQPALKEWLLVSRRVDGEPSIREHVDATVDDLHKACEAVGLVVVEKVGPPKALRLPVRTAARNRQGLDGADAQALEGALTITERERDEAKGEAATLRAQLAAAKTDAEKERANAMGAEEQRDEARSRCREAAQVGIACVGSIGPESVESVVARLVTAVEMLRAQQADITPTEGRATDEELYAVFNGGIGASRENAIRLVAARVRRERPACLVERLVAKGCNFRVEKGCCSGDWVVFVQVPGVVQGPIVFHRNCAVPAAADVPATLARLAGLDGGR